MKKLLLGSVTALLLVASGPAFAGSPTMVTAPGSPATCGVPGNDLCVPGADVFINFPPVAPAVFAGGPAYGLLPGDVINGLSFGLDTFFGGEPIYISVDAASPGVVGAVVVEAAAGEAQADIYFVGLVGAPAGLNLLSVDGDGAPAAAPPASGLVELPAVPPVDELNAMAACDVGTGPLLLGAPIFFTLAPGSPTLGALGAGPADILVSPPGGPPALLVAGAALGFFPGDVIDALSWDGFGFGFVSFAPGSPTLLLFGAGPADIFVPGPAIAIPALLLGLGPLDNVDAIDVLAADVDGDQVNDFCDNCPGVFNNAQLDFDTDGMGDACDPPPTPTATGTATPTPTPAAGGCPATPLPGCDSPGKSILKLKDKNGDGPGAKDQILWKSIKGPAELQTGFGDPTSTASMQLCVYDAAGLALDATVAPGGVCGPKPCWKALGTKGYKFLDKSSVQDGAFKLLVKGDAVNPKTKILFKGRDGALNFSAGNPLLDASGTISVRLANTDNANCWGADFAPATVIKNTDQLFKAKTP